MNPISDRTTSTTFKIPKYDFRYSMSHLIPPRTFLERTGSVVGWYGLLAPEIMEVLEASPSKPSASSVVLMMQVGRSWNLDRQCYHIKPHADKPPGSTSRPQVMFQKAHFVPCRFEVDGENKPDGPLFRAAPRGSSRGGCSAISGAEIPGWGPWMYPCADSSWVQCCVSPK